MILPRRTAAIVFSFAPEGRKSWMGGFWETQGRAAEGRPADGLRRKPKRAAAKFQPVPGFSFSDASECAASTCNYDLQPTPPASRDARRSRLQACRQTARRAAAIAGPNEKYGATPQPNCWSINSSKTDVLVCSHHMLLVMQNLIRGMASILSGVKCQAVYLTEALDLVADHSQ